MPLIHFAKKNRASLSVDHSANLMKSLLAHDLPVASSCHGEGVCAKCRVSVVQGADHLSPASELELHLIKKNNIPKGIRISCQVQVLGDVEIDTGYW